MALGQSDKLGIGVSISQELVDDFLLYRGIELVDLPHGYETVRLAIHASALYGSGKRRLNLADCFHYARAWHYGMRILSTADEFRFTDLEVVP